MRGQRLRDCGNGRADSATRGPSSERIGDCRDDIEAVRPARDVSQGYAEARHIACRGRRHSESDGPNGRADCGGDWNRNHVFHVSLWLGSLLRPT